MTDRCSATDPIALILADRSPAAAATGDTVPVVVSAPVSTEPWIACSIERGARLAVDEINADGGRVGSTATSSKLKLVVLDNASSPATALANAREAVEPQRRRRCSPTAPARRRVAAVTDPAKLPVFILFEGGADLIDPQRYPTLFRLAPADAIMTRRLADYIANGKPKVAMLTDDSGYGEQGRTALRDAFAIDEVEVVSDQVIPRRATRPRAADPRRPPRRRRPADRVGERGRRRRRARGRRTARAGTSPVISGQTGEDPLIRQRLVAHPGVAGVAALRLLADHRRDGPEAVQRVPRAATRRSSAPTRSASSRTAAT